MVRVSIGLLYAASLVLFRLVAAAQMGLSWEVSAAITEGVNWEFFLVSFLIAGSEAALWFARESFAALPGRFRMLYTAWTAVVIIGLLISWNLDVGQWPEKFPAVSQAARNAFWPGAILSTLLFGVLLKGSSGKKL